MSWWIVKKHGFFKLNTQQQQMWLCKLWLSKSCISKVTTKMQSIDQVPLKSSRNNNINKQLTIVSWSIMTNYLFLLLSWQPTKWSFQNLHFQKIQSIDQVPVFSSTVYNIIEQMSIAPLSIITKMSLLQTWQATKSNVDLQSLAFQTLHFQRNNNNNVDQLINFNLFQWKFK